MRGQHHAPPTLPRARTTVPTGWVPGSVRTSLETRTSLGVTSGSRRVINEVCALHSVNWYFVTDVSGQYISPTFNGQTTQAESREQSGSGAGK